MNDKWSRYANDFTLLPTFTGTKTNFASKYMALFDSTKIKYAEPCVGNGGMYFNLPKGKYTKIALNDKNRGLFYVYKSLRDDDLKDEFIRRLNQIEIPQDKEEAKKYFDNLRNSLFYSGTKLTEREDILQVAVRTYVTYAISKNGNADEFSERQAQNFKYDIERRLPNVIDSLEVKPMLGSIDCIEMIKRFADDSSVQWFIDSPYVGIYRTNKPLYKNELIKLEQHVRLAYAVRKCKGAVVMCGYRSKIKGVPTIYDAILGSKFKCYFICEKPNGAVRVKKGQKRPMCKEFVWTNHTPEYAGMYLSLKDYREKISVQKFWNVIMEKIRKGIIPKNQIREYESAFHTCIELELISKNAVWNIKEE